MRLFSGLVCCLVLFSAAQADVRNNILYDTVVDLDRNGQPDRVVLFLVDSGRRDAANPDKEVYMLGEGDRADLLIYLNGTTIPTFRKENVVSPGHLAFVLPPKVSGKGSLGIVSSNGFGNTFNTTETLTIVYREGKFLVGGWAQDFYNSREDASSHCSINYLAGKAVKRMNSGGDVPLQGRFRPVALADWDISTQPPVCEDTE
jgi:hypothetical protein